MLSDVAAWMKSSTISMSIICMREKDDHMAVLCSVQAQHPGCDPGHGGHVTFSLLLIFTVWLCKIVYNGYV